MPDGDPRTDAATGGKTKPRRRFKWRPWLRALHRDFGYLAVGLTIVYALSGLAVNHIADWDPNFVNFQREFQVQSELPEDDQEMAELVLQAAKIDEEPLDIYPLDETQVEITLETSTLFVDRTTGKVFVEGQKERPFLRVANWLHLNRGKKAWTWFADGYAAMLLILAVSGMFMIPGKKGIKGRGAILVALGVMLPVGYLWYVGGP